MLEQRHLEPHDLREDIASILLDEATLQQRISQLGAEIVREYAHINTPLMLICVLKGGYIFLADLSRALNIPHEVEFMAVSSYGDDVKSSGVVQILLDLSVNIADRHVLLVEDIIDSGRTLEYIRQNFLSRKPASLKICSLLSKPSRREIDVPVDFLGFEVPDEFVVGYGLDYAQLYRNLPFIAVLKPDVFS